VLAHVHVDRRKWVVQDVEVGSAVYSTRQRDALLLAAWCTYTHTHTHIPAGVSEVSGLAFCHLVCGSQQHREISVNLLAA
jgi:hypothetical protein